MSSKVERAEQLLREANKAVGEMQFELAQKNAEQASEIALEVIQEAEQFVKRIGDLEVELDKAEHLLTEGKEDAEQAQELLAELAASFNRKSWSELKDNPQRALKNFEIAQKLVASANESLEQQKWDEAESQIKEAHAALRETEMLTISVAERLETLKSAAANMPKLMEATLAEIEEAATYIKKHDDDVEESLETDLASVQEPVRKASALLEADLPDYIEIKSILAGVRKTVHRILDEAQEDVQIMARVSKSASQEVDDAVNEVDHAENYIDDHRRDVKQPAKDLYDEANALAEKAKKALKEADELDGVDEKEQERLDRYRLADKYANQAQEKAQEALNKAKGDVKRANSYSSGTGSGGTTIYAPTYNTYSSTPRRDTYSAPKSNWGSPSISRPSTSSPSISRPSTSRPSVSSSRSVSRPSVSRPSVSRPSVSRPSGGRRR
jgi:hypothetical protein